MFMWGLEDAQETFEKELQNLNSAVIKKRVKKETLLKEKQDLEEKVADLNIGNLEKAAVALKELAQNQKKSASEELSKLGTMALQYSLGPDYKMEIETEGSAKNAKTFVWLIKDDKYDEKEDPQEDNGGGIIDIMGSSMRLEILDNYDEPPIDGPIVFDEPFKMVSREYRPMLSQFVRNVSEDFGRQVIAVTHDDYLSAMTDSNIYVSLDENKRSLVQVQKIR